MVPVAQWATALTIDRMRRDPKFFLYWPASRVSFPKSAVSDTITKPDLCRHKVASNCGSCIAPQNQTFHISIDLCVCTYHMIRIMQVLMYVVISVLYISFHEADVF